MAEHNDCLPCAHFRAAAYRAVDALEAGDLEHAAAVLYAVLDDAPAPPRCAICGARAWPGDHARHIYSAHRAAEEAYARAA